jgi:tetratricopeptide (TPR) repeat protein
MLLKIRLFFIITGIFFIFTSCSKENNSSTEPFRGVKEQNETEQSNSIVQNDTENTSQDNADFNWALYASSQGFKSEIITAEELNSLGFELYKDGRYRNAYELFKQATFKDPGFAKAHFNVGCMLSLLLESGESADTEELYSGLEKALSLDAGMLNNVINDSDLQYIRESVRYRDLVIRYSEKDKEFPDYSGLIPGYWELTEEMPGLMITFYEDGTADLSEYYDFGYYGEGTWNFNVADYNFIIADFNLCLESGRDGSVSYYESRLTGELEPNNMIIYIYSFGYFSPGDSDEPLRLEKLYH